MAEPSRAPVAPSFPVTSPAADVPGPALPAGASRTGTVRSDAARWALEDAVDLAEAAVAAGERRVGIARLLLEELPDDAPGSARAAAQDRVAGATADQTAAHTRLRRAVDALRTAEDAPAARLPTLVYADADTWVRSWLLPSWRRPLRQRWCPKWWLHAEAVSRFEALWRAWEHLRGEGALGPSVWWRDHADHHLAVLTSERGPFAACSPDRGHRATADELPAVADPLDLADFVGRPARRPA